MKKAVKLIVQGTVQGIFFRQFVKEYADNFGLTGFVRNLTEGEVEVIAEGEGKQIKKLIEFVKKGPKHAQIRNVKIEEKRWSGEFKEFKILRF